MTVDSRLTTKNQQPATVFSKEKLRGRGGAWSPRIPVTDQIVGSNPIARAITQLSWIFPKFSVAAQSAAQCVLRGKSVPLGALWRASRFAKTRISICFARKKNFCFLFLRGIIKLLKLINLVKGILFDKNRILQGAGNWLTSTINLLLSSPF